MIEELSRTALIYGDEATERLSKMHVAVFGIGGVGGYVAEALARSGVGTLSLIDSDKVSLSNINRQIIATQKTVGRYKTEVMAERIREINPRIAVNTFNVFFLPETAHLFDFAKYDYIVDAVDTVTAKTELILSAEKSGTPIISAMGAGNKRDASAFEVADIYETSVCPLARVMRHELKKRGIKSLKVVYSKEQPISPKENPTTEKSAKVRPVPGSTAFCPSVVGLIAASEVVNDLIG